MGSKAILLLGLCLAVLLLIASEVTAMDFVKTPISNQKTVQENGVDDAKYRGGGYPGVGYGGFLLGGYEGNRGGGSHDRDRDHSHDRDRARGRGQRLTDYP